MTRHAGDRGHMSRLHSMSYGAAVTTFVIDRILKVQFFFAYRLLSMDKKKHILSVLRVMNNYRLKKKLI
jgi:hypothetical protein